MPEFLMPSLGADMDAGTVVEWRVEPGDEVHRGDIVAVVDTDKSDIEVEVFEDGVIEELLVEVGRQVPVGTPLARLGPVGARPAPAPTSRRTRRRAPRPPSPAVADMPARVRASPRARRAAADRGIDLREVHGTGPSGAVLASDLDGTAEPRPPAAAPAPAVAPAERSAAERHASMRRAIGDLMARSWREVPHYHLVTTVDLARALSWLGARNAQSPVSERLLPAALLVRATALAAREVPSMNGFWNEAGFAPSDHVHVGVAVSLRGGGLVAPAILDADRLDVTATMAALRDLVERARAGRLRSGEMASPTITVTNLGDQGSDEVLGVIYPPQVALVGFGRVHDEVRAVDGLVGVRPVVRVSLAGDHRASDGHDGSRFLAAIERLLQGPEEL